MSEIPVLVINCAADVERRASVVAGLQGVEPIWIDAIDARMGAGVFKPFAHLIADQFWMKDEIKPGAFGCFMSHRMAWQNIVDAGHDRALIMEDDSRLIAGWHNQMETDAELLFVNNRAAQMAPRVDIQSILENNANDRPRAIGGDGYILTRNGAKTLLALSDHDGVQCGVDWYMAYAGLETVGLSHAEVKAIPEIKRMYKMFGPRSAQLTAQVLQRPIVINNGTFDSSIKHSHRVKISDFRQAIEQA